MSATIIVRLSLHRKDDEKPYNITTGFIPSAENIWDLKNNITKLLQADQFMISKKQPLDLENMDAERMTFAISWACDPSTGDLPKSEFGNGDVKELMEAMKNRGWRDVLDVKVVFDPAVKNGLETMTEGERAWAPIAARVDEEHRLAKIKFAQRLAEQQSG